MLNIIILAAGKGVRMKSDNPKVLTPVAGGVMIDYAIDISEKLNPNKIIVVVGAGGEKVKEHLKDRNIIFATQKEQKGTADAVSSALEYIDDNSNTLILCGDMPLIKYETLRDFIASSTTDISFISTKMENPKGYGRVIRASGGAVLKIVEEKDANDYEKKVNEVNTGVYFCNSQELKKRIKNIDNNNAQNEYYLTDIIKGGEHTFLADDYKEFLGVNDRLQLSYACGIIYKTRAEEHMKNGVSFVNPDNVYIDKDVAIGKDTIIYPNVFLEKGTKIGENVTIYQGCRISKATISDGCIIKDNSLIEEAFVGENSTIGPMAHLRPGSYLQGNNKIGNFVELKKAKLGKGTKASHLTYLGDTIIGDNTNIGCGTITCNYDGYNKYETIIADNVFIGSDSQLVAPVNIGDNTLIAAGSTITKDVKENMLAIARAKQVNYEDKGKEIMELNKAKKEKK